MVTNIADAIEDYIRQRLAQNEDQQLELKRTVLADEINCAPSQISYVLSTRFTVDRGFIVESRRGLGGYIRITLVPEKIDQKQLIYHNLLKDINERTSFKTIKEMLQYLLDEKQLITRREAELSVQMAWNLYRSERYGEIPATTRAKLIRSNFATLAQIA